MAIGGRQGYCPGLPGPGKIPSFNPYIPHERNSVIAGVTRDSIGVALPGCTVELVNVLTRLVEQTLVSGADGSFCFAADKTQTYFLRAKLNGTGNVAGTSLETLLPVVPV